MSPMDEVMAAGKDVAEVYAQLLQASDALAEAMHYDCDFVLRRVLPMNATERRNATKVWEFLKTEADAVESHLKHVAKVRAQAAARQELLAKLKLSEAEKKLLGINPKNHDEI